MSAAADLDICEAKLWVAVIALTARDVRNRRRNAEAAAWLAGFGADVLWPLGCSDLAELATRGARGDREALEELIAATKPALYASRETATTSPERRPRTSEDRSRSMREAWERRRVAAAAAAAATVQQHHAA